MSLTAALTGLSIGQRIAGAAIGLLVWLLPAFIVWAYMTGKLDTQYKLGHAAASQQCAEAKVDALATAMAEAREEWTRTQGAITDQAGKDASDLAKFLADARKRAGLLSEEFRSYAAAHPLPAGCTHADPGRVELFNRARRGDPPAR